jgi:hypothetical protein
MTKFNKFFFTFNWEEEEKLEKKIVDNPFLNIQSNRKILKRGETYYYDDICWVDVNNLKRSCSKTEIQNKEIIYWYLDENTNELHWSNIDSYLNKLCKNKLYENGINNNIVIPQSTFGSNELLENIGLFGYRVCEFKGGGQYLIRIDKNGKDFIFVCYREIIKC